MHVRIPSSMENGFNFLSDLDDLRLSAAIRIAKERLGLANMSNVILKQSYTGIIEAVRAEQGSLGERADSEIAKPVTIIHQIVQYKSLIGNQGRRRNTTQLYVII